MPRTDYESAWRELGEWVSTTTKDGRPKTGFGRAEIASKMIELQARHVVPEGLLETAARVYGLPAVADVANPPEGRSSAARPEAEADATRSPGPPTTEGGHSGTDGSQDREAAAVAA